MAFFQMDKNEKKNPQSEEEFRQYAKSVFDNAEEYYFLVKKVLPEALLKAGDALFANMAFSCELYLKSILVYEKCVLIKGHQLLGLYEQIESKEVKTTIRKAINRDDFDLCLKEASKSFEVIRYAYEYKQMVCNVEFMMQFMFVLRATANHFVNKNTADK